MITEYTDTRRAGLFTSGDQPVMHVEFVEGTPREYKLEPVNNHGTSGIITSVRTAPRVQCAKSGIVVPQWIPAPHKIAEILGLSESSRLPSRYSRASRYDVLELRRKYIRDARAAVRRSKKLAREYAQAALRLAAAERRTSVLEGKRRPEHPTDYATLVGSSTGSDYIVTHPNPSTNLLSVTLEGHMASWLCPLPENVTSDYRYLVEARAMQKVYAKAAQTMQFQGITFLAELKKTIELYRSVVKRGLSEVLTCVERQRSAKLNLEKTLKKIWASEFNAVSRINSRRLRTSYSLGHNRELLNEWLRHYSDVSKYTLAYEFGILGLKRDLLDFHKTWQKVVKRPRRKRISASAFSEPYVLLKNTKVVQDSSLQGSSVNFQVSTRRTCGCYATLVLKDYVPESLSRDFGFSILDLGTQLWELTSFSYAVDWFVGIGGMLNMLASHYRQSENVLDSSITYTEESETSAQILGGMLYYYAPIDISKSVNSTHTMKRKRVIRNVKPSSPLFPLPGPVLSLGFDLVGAIDALSTLGVLAGKLVSKVQ